MALAEQRKYVILTDGQNEYPIIFDRRLSHVDVAKGVIQQTRVSKWSKILLPLDPISAGFVYFPDMQVGDEGSESLDLSPRPQDAALLRSIATSESQE